jgi:hypothetical protein
MPFSAGSPLALVEALEQQRRKVIVACSKADISTDQ